MASGLDSEIWGKSEGGEDKVVVAWGGEGKHLDRMLVDVEEVDDEGVEDNGDVNKGL